VRIKSRTITTLFIANISPTDCPFTNMMGKAKAENTYFEWQTDALASPNTGNAQIEGDDTSIAAVTPTVGVGNRTQISNASVVLSRTEETVKKAGRSSELSYQIVKKTKELKRDMEAIPTQNQTAAVRMLVGQRLLLPAIPVANDTAILKFGGVDAPLILEKQVNTFSLQQVPKVVILPQGSCLIHIWLPSQSGAASFIPEMGWIERAGE